MVEACVQENWFPEKLHPKSAGALKPSGSTRFPSGGKRDKKYNSQNLDHMRGEGLLSVL